MSSDSAVAAAVSLRGAFRKYDEDDSGAISADELGNLCSELGFELDDSTLERALNELDTNRDGTVGFEEFSAWWEGQNDSQSMDVTGVKSQLKEIAKRGRVENHVDIHSACFYGSEATVREFLAIDSTLSSLPDNTEFGENNCPLHYAAYCGSLEICQLLLGPEGRANVNARNDSGCTALFLASQQGHSDVVSFLLKQGARINIGDKKQGWSPIEVSANDEVTALLCSECDTSIPKRPSSRPSVYCSKPGRLEVSWSYRGGEQSAARSLPVGSFIVQIFRSNLVNGSDEESDDEPLSPNPATQERCDKVLKEVSVKGGDSNRVELKVEYPFPLQARFAARNASGQSEWSDRSDEVLCASVPLITKAPVAQPLSRTSIEVSWALPNKNGAALQAIKLEVNDGQGEWESLGVFPISVHSQVVESLRPGISYSFRIICSNAAGKSKPGPCSAPIRTK